MRAVNNNVIRVQIINHPRNEGLPGLLAGSGGAYGDYRIGEAIENVRLYRGFGLTMGFEEISLDSIATVRFGMKILIAAQQTLLGV